MEVLEEVTMYRLRMESAPLLGSVFFFQAEDGIRDLIVTGVQTCALPISPPARPAPLRIRLGHRSGAVRAAPRRGPGRGRPQRKPPARRRLRPAPLPLAGGSEERRVGEEGRSRGAPDH